MQSEARSWKRREISKNPTNSPFLFCLSLSVQRRNVRPKLLEKESSVTLFEWVATYCSFSSVWFTFIGFDSSMAKLLRSASYLRRYMSPQLQVFVFLCCHLPILCFLLEVEFFGLKNGRMTLFSDHIMQHMYIVSHRLHVKTEISGPLFVCCLILFLILEVAFFKQKIEFKSKCCLEILGKVMLKLKLLFWRFSLNKRGDKFLLTPTLAFPCLLPCWLWKWECIVSCLKCSVSVFFVLRDEIGKGVKRLMAPNENFEQQIHVLFLWFAGI